MKVRKGFVSNSSSSSFVLIGFKVDKKTVEVLEALYGGKDGFPKKGEVKRERGCEHPVTDATFCGECGKAMWLSNEVETKEDYGDAVREYGWNLPDDEDTIIVMDEATPDGILVGVNIPTGSEGDFRAFDFDTVKLNAQLSEVRQKLGLPENEKPKIFTGIENC